MYNKDIKYALDTLVFILKLPFAILLLVAMITAMGCAFGMPFAAIFLLGFFLWNWISISFSYALDSITLPCFYFLLGIAWFWFYEKFLSNIKLSDPPTKET
jgi:hypothetical protein